MAPTSSTVTLPVCRCLRKGAGIPPTLRAFAGSCRPRKNAPLNGRRHRPTSRSRPVPGCRAAQSSSLPRSPSPSGSASPSLRRPGRCLAKGGVDRRRDERPGSVARRVCAKLAGPMPSPRSSCPGPSDSATAKCPTRADPTSKAAPSISATAAPAPHEVHIGTCPTACGAPSASGVSGRWTVSVAACKSAVRRASRVQIALPAGLPPESPSTGRAAAALTGCIPPSPRSRTRRRTPCRCPARIGRSGRYRPPRSRRRTPWA